MRGLQTASARLEPVELANASALERYVAWVADSALPYWAQKRANLILPFAEQLDRAGHSAWPGYLRLRVIARQVSVYAQAAAAGLTWALPVAESGWQAMERYFWSTVSGWHARVGSNGQAVDTEFTLYDQAFALYACAHWARVSGAQEPVDMACRTLDLIDRRLRLNEQPGWRTAFDNQEHDQNSHMHFLEALLALLAVAPEWRVRGRIEEILNLLAIHMVDPNSGAVLEWFDMRWQPPEDGGVVEPGHQYEWAWLLAQATRAGFVCDVPVQPMLTFADNHGWCPEKDLIYDSCRPDGAVLRRHHQLWPHCEALRAATVPDDAEAGMERAERIAGHILNRFAGRPFAEGWVSHLDEHGVPAVDTVPATSLYHLFEAALALVRCGWATFPEAER